ncbi:hypothetical protein VIN01S_24180 [Vibrio inusitatus NBRC 102082]|uniref:Uncharacterized protein n=1 Tax=Vibrio inusitatus NBRC 102082 TaxID=1219070 RepID=A0A4Y3HZG0_9VIBR|nr:hypothetical protein [Vibrio inusitatus]GEA51614.1 hypothetical protein VIN01S_24180 [Vibrio inusitatus NBRC 102082]
MKLLKQALPIIAVCSTLAFAQGVAAKNITQDSQFTDQMTQIEQVFDEQVYVVTDSDFTGSTAVLDVEKEMGDIYVTKEQVKELGLTETKSFHVYCVIDQSEISKRIAKLIRQDSPKYFSVALYENQMGNSDMVEYVAKVTEYK